MVGVDILCYFTCREVLLAPTAQATFSQSAAFKGKNFVPTLILKQ